MIRLEQLSFQYADSPYGVSNIDLSIRKGECVVLTGPSGGGKTTLTRLLNGLAPGYYAGVRTGRILLDGRDLEQLAQHQIGRQVGSVFQDPKSQFFSSELTGEVAFACENYGLQQQEIRHRTNSAIHTFALEPLRERELDVLSSGEKQRVAIAAIYALGPHIYVCDEPTANLDWEGTRQLAQALRRLKAEGHTLVIAEHRLAWLRGIADRFLYLRDGRLLWAKRPEELEAMSAEERERYGLREAAERQMPALPPPEPVAASIRARGLSCKKNGIYIFRDRSLSASAGRITAITGMNGAGKTSLALVLAGLWRESGGSVEITGKPLGPAARRKLVWYGSNDTGTQFFTDSVTKELLLNGEQTTPRLEQARALLKRLGLYSYKDVHPATLSGGQKQRLSIACGLLSGREILILDEPTSGLDGGNMRMIAEVLRDTAGNGKTVLVITHDDELIRDCCDDCWNLNK